MNKPVCLGLSVLGLSKILMYEFSYDCVKPKYCEKTKLCYMDTDDFTVYIFTKTLQNMLKQGLILQIMNQKYHFLKEKIKK